MREEQLGREAEKRNVLKQRKKVAIRCPPRIEGKEGKTTKEEDSRRPGGKGAGRKFRKEEEGEGKTDVHWERAVGLGGKKGLVKQDKGLAFEQK